MNYLLTSVNKTQSRAIAVRDYIKMAFKIAPNEIRYDSNIPSMDTNLTSIGKDVRELTIKERITNLISDIQISTEKVSLNSVIEVTDSKYEVSITVGEENLKFKL
jgi:hypothetical protein